MIELLLRIGFSENEAKLYIALLDLVEGTVDEIVKIAGVRRPTAYSVMRGLVDKGLVAEVTGKPVRFRVLPPNRTLKGLFQNEIEEVKRLSKELPITAGKFIEQANELYKKQPVPTDAEREFVVLRGKKVVYDMLGPVQLQKCIRTITRPPLQFPLYEAAKNGKREYAKQGMIEYLLCESDMLMTPDFAKAAEFYLEIGQQVRHLPSIPIKVFIFDESSCLVVAKSNGNPDELISLFVRNRELVATFIASFEYFWNEAEPVRYEDIEEALKNA